MDGWMEEGGKRRQTFRPTELGVGGDMFIEESVNWCFEPSQLLGITSGLVHKGHAVFFCLLV